MKGKNRIDLSDTESAVAWPVWTGSRSAQLWKIYVDDLSDSLTYSHSAMITLKSVSLFNGGN